MEDIYIIHRQKNNKLKKLCQKRKKALLQSLLQREPAKWVHVTCAHFVYAVMNNKHLPLVTLFCCLSLLLRIFLSHSEHDPNFHKKELKELPRFLIPCLYCLHCPHQLEWFVTILAAWVCLKEKREQRCWMYWKT